MLKVKTSTYAYFYCLGWIAYCDNILSYPKVSLQLNVELVNKVLSKSEAVCGQVKMQKEKFGQEQVTFLGVDVSRHGWQIFNNLLKSLRDPPVSQTRVSVQL